MSTAAQGSATNGPRSCPVECRTTSDGPPQRTRCTGWRHNTTDSGRARHAYQCGARYQEDNECKVPHEVLASAREEQVRGEGRVALVGPRQTRVRLADLCTCHRVGDRDTCGCRLRSIPRPSLTPAPQRPTHRSSPDRRSSPAAGTAQWCSSGHGGTRSERVLLDGRTEHSACSTGNRATLVSDRKGLTTATHTTACEGHSDHWHARVRTSSSFCTSNGKSPSWNCWLTVPRKRQVSATRPVRLSMRRKLRYVWGGTPHPHRHAQERDSSSTGTEW